LRCEICGAERPSRAIPLCPECSKKEEAIEYVKKIHEGVEKIGRESRWKCDLCANECGLEENDRGLCGLRGTKNGKFYSLTSPDRGVLYAYEDPLPTNCCNAWFCKGSKLRGTNLAIFYYGCSFDCLFCQNWSHKDVKLGKVVSVEEMVERAMDERIKCICHFGGSPEPQLPFAIKFSEEVLKRREVMICWEWNGSGRRDLALKAAEISARSGRTVKFDLKAWNENLHEVLTGRSNKRALENFKAIFEKYPEVLSATTLLVPYYVDEGEVEKVASFISSLDDTIPYSLLVFHPDYRLSDLPVTPPEQVKRCYAVAKKHLKNVNVGNLHLLGLKELK